MHFEFSAPASGRWLGRASPAHSKFQGAEKGWVRFVSSRSLVAGKVTAAPALGPGRRQTTVHGWLPRVSGFPPEWLWKAGTLSPGRARVTELK